MVMFVLRTGGGLGLFGPFRGEGSDSDNGRNNQTGGICNEPR